MRCDECGTALYEAGEVVPAGAYMRVDDGMLRQIVLECAGPLPPSYDGHIAWYRAAAAPCRCDRCAAVAALRERQASERIVAYGARRKRSK